MRNNRSRMFYFALPVLLAACVLQSSLANAQVTSLGVDCSKVDVSRLMMEDNLGAGRILIECGYAPGGQPVGRGIKSPAPPNVRVSNRACSAGTCTKSESMVSASTKNPKNLVVQYNDDSGSTLAGTSYSNDGGVTFHEIQPPPLANGHGFNVGDPIVIFNSKLNKWFAGDLALGCGGQGIGLWTSPDGKTWTTGACAHNGSGDDRESFWVDNEPTSGKYGRMYISFNDFNTGGGALSLVYSDNGTSWTGPVILNSGFIRDVQITGSPRGAARFEGKNSTVFVAAMDEGGGGLSTRQNIIYKSLDGGASWSAITMGARFNPPGDRTCTEYNPYFAVVNPIWRHMGWGEPAVGPKGVVHYVFAGKGTGNDTGDIFYTRSINNGKTWSKPIKLNTDPDGSFKTQWMPSLSATSDGEITASWYDRRKATSACNSVTDPGCKYERVGRQSKTNGASFLPEVTISSAIIPEPIQGDSGIVPCYAGDYDYNTALNKGDSGTATGVAYVTWTDGRRVVSGSNVQDVDFAKVPEP
jgi:hypothetical protein